MAKQYRFPEGNTIVYGQDMGFWEGVPSNVVFTEREEYLGKRTCLTAPGYGGEPGTKDYGNGAIYVDRANLPEPLEEEDGVSATDKIMQECEQAGSQLTLTYPATQSVPFCCPVCLGKGIVPAGFYMFPGSEWTSSSLNPETCRSCDGTGIAWRK